MNEFAEALEKHTAEDHAFQDETRLFNGEMAMFKAETEGSFSLIHEKLDLILKKQIINDNRFDPNHRDYAFGRVDQLCALVDGLTFTRKALVVLGSVMLSIGAIVGGFVAAVRFVK